MFIAAFRLECFAQTKRMEHSQQKQAELRSAQHNVSTMFVGDKGMQEGIGQDRMT